MRAPFATAIAIAVGLIVLVGYFIQIPLLLDIRTILLGWAVTVAGVAGLIGIINLIMVHWRRFTAPRGRDFYSALVIILFLVTFGAGLVLGPGDPIFQKFILSIQVPLESSLIAVLAVSLVYASLRFLHKRNGVTALVFIISVLIFLVVSAGLLSSIPNMPLIGRLLTFLNQLPIAGARGILIGIALGSLATGLRILMGADRPYSG
jgi:hypothetical protein